MKILLTNDDGIHAAGIKALLKELKKIATVTVVAPDSERSSVGHAITLLNPLQVNKVFSRRSFLGYGLSGTPADCIKFGISVILKNKPDLVVSGINLGDNDGCSVFYSGTVAGAREGAIMGIPSLSISLATFVDPYFAYAAKLSAKLAAAVFKKGLPKGTFLNVNIPNQRASKIKGFRITQQSTVPIHSVFTKKSDKKLGNLYWMSGKMPCSNKNLRIDTSALRQDYATITPIHCDTTDYGFLQELKGWKL